MKTLKTRVALLTLATLILSTTFAKAGITGTMIDVLGGAYYDRAWVFAVNGTTYGFDNGWDGYKFLSSSTIAPQIYIPGDEGSTYQIAAIPDLDNAPINFIPGQTIEYTLLFTHTNIASQYKELYLVDNIANKKVDIYADGSTYKFNATVGDVKERFKLVAVVYPPYTPPTDTVVVTPPTEPQDTTVVTPPANPQDTTVVTPPANDKNTGNDKRDKKHKKVAVYCVGNKIIIDNTNEESANTSIIDATTGKKVKQMPIHKNNKTTIETNIKKGVYIVSTIFSGMADNERIVIR